MELDASIEPTIGPYETYEDEWFGYKAAFEAFVTIRDDAETKKLGGFGSQLQGLEDALPIDPKYRNAKLGALAPIRVVNVVFTAGDANRGVQTAAFNLPNDDRVVREKGSKRVMLKNVQDAKFQKVLLPIAAVALSPADRATVSFDAFFTHILMHELMHGLGPAAGPWHDGGRAAGAQGHLLGHRGGQGRHLGAVGPAAARGQGRRVSRDCEIDVHDVRRVGVPIDPLRPQRSARPRHRAADQLPARPRRRRRQRRRHVRRRRCRRCARPSRA